MLQQAWVEAVPILLAIGCPGLLGQSQCTWKYHVLHLSFCGNTFAPDVALHTLYQLQLLYAEVGRHNVACVERLQGVVVLSVVKIAEGKGAQNHLVAAACRALNHVGMVATPPVHGSRLAYTAFQNLVPSNQLLAVLVEVLLHCAGEPRLQFSLVFHALILDALLAVGTSLPRRAVHLVATNLHVFVWKELEDLLVDILDVPILFLCYISRTKLKV